MSKALFLLAAGFEELEFIAPYDILSRGGVEVKTSSISDKKEVSGVHGVTVSADSILQQLEGLPFDLLVLPGGGLGTDNLLKSNLVKNLLIKSCEAGKKIAAICAAPTVLAKAGILSKHEITGYPSIKEDIKPYCKKYLDVPVVVSENIITSKGAGTAAEFGFCLLSLMVSPETAEDVKRKMRF